MNVFIIDSPNPFDILEGRNEHKAIEEICRSMDHKSYSFFAKSKQEFDSVIDYISSVNGYSSTKSQRKICIHISAHGYSGGISFGKDDLTWSELCNSLIPILELTSEYEVLLILSACGTNNQTLTSYIENTLNDSSGKYTAPEYILAFNVDEVAWRDSLLIWTIFYHQINKVKNKSDMQNIINIIKKSGFSDLKYRRWDKTKNKYLQFKGKSSD